MNRVIDRIEIERNYPNSYFIIYYKEYKDNYNYEIKMDKHPGDEEELERFFGKKIEELKKIYDIRTIVKRYEPLVRDTENYLAPSSKNPNEQLNASDLNLMWHQFRGYHEERVSRRKVRNIVITITAITVLVGSGFVLMRNYPFKKVAQYKPKSMIEYQNGGSKIDKFDMILNKDYEEFEMIFAKLIAKDYDGLTQNDLRFFSDYLDNIFTSNNNNYSNDRSYRSAFLINFSNQLSSLPVSHQTRIKELEKAYNDIFVNLKSSIPSFSEEKAKVFCKMTMDFVMGDYSFKVLPPTEKMVILKQLKSIVTAINFDYSRQYKKEAWFLMNSYDYASILEYLDNEIANMETLLKSDLSQEKRV